MILKKELLNHKDLINKSLREINRLFLQPWVIYYNFHFEYKFSRKSGLSFGYELMHPSYFDDKNEFYGSNQPEFYFCKSDYKNDSKEKTSRRLASTVSINTYFSSSAGIENSCKGIELSHYLNNVCSGFQIKRYEFVTDPIKKAVAIIAFKETIDDAYIQKTEHILLSTLIKMYSDHMYQFTKHNTQKCLNDQNRMHELKRVLNALFKLNLFELEELFSVIEDQKTSVQSAGFGTIIPSDTDVRKWYVIPDTEKYSRIKKYIMTWFDSSELLNEVTREFHMDNLKDYILKIFEIVQENDILIKSLNTLQPVDPELLIKNKQFEKSLILSLPNLIVEQSAPINYSDIRNTSIKKFDLHFFQLMLSVLSNIVMHNYRENNIRLEISISKPYIYLAFFNLIDSKNKRLINETIDKKNYGSKQAIEFFAEKINAELTDFEAMCTEFVTIIQLNIDECR